MKLAIIFGLALLVCSTAYAQSEILGKYSGTVTAPNNRNRDIVYPLVLEINAADNGKLKGSITSSASGTCGRGAREAEGTFEGNNVKFAETGQAKLQGCDALQFEGIVDGNKLVGKVLLSGALRNITLSK